MNGYAESEEIASTDIKLADFPTILKSLHEDRLRVRDEVKRISQEVAPDVDGWIAQAKRLQVDIEQSKAVAREIVQQAEAAGSLRQQHQELAQKCILLEGEVTYTKRLENALGNIRSATNALGQGRQAAAHGDIEGALDRVRNVMGVLVELRSLENTTVIELISQRMDQLRANLIEDVTRQWDLAIYIDSSNQKLTFRNPNSNQLPTLKLSIDKLVDLSSELDILQENIMRSCSRITSNILKPRLEMTGDRQVAQLSFTEHEISISGVSEHSDALSLLNDIASTATILNNNLPPSTSVMLSESLMPPLVSYLLTHWLMPSIPTNLAGLGEFQELLQRAEKLAIELEQIGWSGSGQLRDWVEQGPKNWLGIRREDSLAVVRRTLAQGVQTTKTVERVETQKVSTEELAIAQESNGDNWDLAWSEGAAEPVSPTKTSEKPAADDDDFDAWDTGEATDEHSPTVARKQSSTGGEGVPDEGDAWGWNEHDANIVPASPVKERKVLSKLNGDKQAVETNGTHLTLKEVYTVTAVPDELCTLIVQISRDAESLRSPQFEDSAISPAAVALYTVPTLILAGFRALAPTFYVPLVGGNMFLYNDSMRLASELQAFVASQAVTDEASGLSKSAWPSTRMRLETDIAAIEGFGRRAYGKEMESQRVILRDLLDGAQGFTNCSESPFAAACEDAVKSAIDRIREVARQWESILSRSALLQSLGSLCTTVTSKMIVDIEDLSDISETESQRLRQFCNEVSTLSDLFMQENPAVSGDKKDMTALYVPDWIKFQYLSEIMDSSLADIKYFWTETNLRLEFDANELVDLVEALFADTDLRRRAIADIRR